MEDRQTAQLGQDRIGRLLIKFSVPATIGTLINSLYNVIDRIFIGQGIGADGLAAAMIAFPLMMMVMAFGMLIAFGSNAMISIRLGEKKKDEAEKILGQALFLFFVFSALFTTLGLFFLTPLLKLFGASENVLPLARDYAGIIIIGTISHEISFGVNNFIRGEGNPRIAMLTMVIGAGLNIILDPIFIFALHMGIKGAAFATIIAQTVSAVWVLYYYVNGPSVLKIRKRYLNFNLALARRVVIIGSPPFVMNIVNVFILAFVNNALKQYGGDLAIAVMGVIFTIYTLNFMPVIGLSQGAQPIIGYNFGAKNFARVKHTFTLSAKIVSYFCLVATALIMLFPKYTFMPFSRENVELILLGRHAIRITLAMFPFIGLMVITSNYFQATERPQISLFLSMLRQILILIPCVLILPRFIGLDGIWLSYPVSAVSAFILTLFFYLREIKKLKKLSGLVGTT